MKISFTDFWPCFDPNNNFFTNFLKKYRSDIEVVTPEKADILFFCSKKYSNTENHRKYRCRKIYYQMENLEYPNLNDCDFCLTYDYDKWGEKNIRLPYWMLCLNWFDLKQGYCNDETPHHCGLGNPISLISPDNIDNNIYTTKEKSKFCCIVVNHLRNKREETINKLKLYKQVDCYGKVFNNRLSTFPYDYYDVRDIKKLELISNYKFNICFEANIRPGYVCEKILHAKAAGCIPLTYIDKTVSTDFNPKCFVNLEDFNSIDDYVDKIIEIDNNNMLYNDLRQQPLFEGPVSLDPLYEQFKKIFC